MQFLLFKHVTDKVLLSMNLIPFVDCLKKSFLAARPLRSCIQIVPERQIGSLRWIFWADADARWSETSLRLNVHMVPLGSPRDTSISLHCNYVWWQNYDSRMAGWPEVKCLVRRYFIAHLTNIEPAHKTEKEKTCKKEVVERLLGKTHEGSRKEIYFRFFNKF